MARTERKGAHLGGIGTMLIQSDICPSCGRVHESRLVRYFAGMRPENLPTSPLAAPPTSVSGALPTVGARPGARKPNQLNVPWPMPSGSEGYP